MKITKLEPVIHTYCDMCGREITNEGRYGSYDNNGKEVDICTGYPSGHKYKFEMFRDSDRLQERCIDKFEREKAIAAGDKALN